ncbi:MAG: fatty acyl-CoA synthetase [Acidimicrobiales bacterium]
MTGECESKVAGLVARARRQTLGDVLHRTACRHPERLAVKSASGSFTYEQFEAAANRAAHSLAERGLVKGDRLALLSHNCWQFAVLTFATAKLGVLLVPVNFMLNSAEVGYILGHCEANAVVTEDSLAATMDEAVRLSELTPRVRGVICLTGGDFGAGQGWEDVDGWWDRGPSGEPDVAVGDDDPIRLMYTSGTESRPKGVMLSSRSLIAQYVSCVVDGSMSGDDVEVHSLPMYHCAQLDCFFCVDVYLGASSIILDSPEPARLLETVEAERATKLFCPPTVWVSLLRHPDFDRRDLSSLRKGYYGASPMPVEVLKEIQRRLPGLDLWNFYGQTEMAPLATILGPHEQTERAGSAGRAAVNVETSVVDDQDRPVPPGTVGEIVHRSPHATLGYYKDDDKTASAFRNGWFHSGDLGVMSDDGYLSVVDRIKDMIKTGGENVASREVEEVLFEVPGVAEVAVFGISHPRWVEAVTAVVVAKVGATLSVDDIAAHARGRLAGYKRPKYVAFADSLPKNPSGKILKRELRERYGHLSKQDQPSS